MSKNTVGFIVLGIVSIAGLVLGGYSFLTTQIFVEPEEPGSKLVGIWEGLDDNYDYAPHTTSSNWLFTLLDNSYIDSEYISVNNTGTCITLKKQGWYRIQLSVLLQNLDAPDAYQIDLLKNGTVLFSLYFISTWSAYDPYYHHVHAEGYVLSDGNDYIEINAKSGIDAFYPYTANQNFNQLVIEFVSN